MNTNAKALSWLALTAVVTLLVLNLYLFQRYRYRAVSFLATALSEKDITEELLYRFDIGFKAERMQRNGSLGNKSKLSLGYVTEELMHTDLTAERKESVQENRSHHTKGNASKLSTGYRTEKLMQKSNTADPAAGRKENLQRNGTSKTQLSSGYVVALKIYEQQTMATGNLLQLQCFSSKLNLSVVQPSMKDSCLSTPLEEAQRRHMLQMEDVYGMQEWREHTLAEGYNQLVRWEEFIEHAPRNLILVQMKYPTLNHVRHFRESGVAFPHPLSQRRDYQRGCGFKILHKAFAALQRKNFHVVRRVCYNFLSGDEIPFQIYQRDILGEHNDNNVTVVIDEWRGFGENQRTLIKEKICPESAQYRSLAPFSSKVLRDAQLYANRYLQQYNSSSSSSPSSSSSSPGYLAVIARFEMTALTRRASSKNDTYAIIPVCVRETLKNINIMKRKMKLSETFLSVDIGKYGSNSFGHHNYYGHQRDLESFVASVYHDKLNVTDWEKTFESTAETLDSGYIAKMQQALVVRAKCVLFVGGGSFQQHTLHLYQKLHPDAADRCVKIIKSCTSASRPVQ